MQPALQLHKLLFSVCWIIPLLGYSSSALAHSGRVDGNGCHAGSQPYHCHRGSSGGRAERRILGRSVGGDLDCKDFNNWQEAQLFYQRSGPGDPHGLDRDNDGIACEHLRW